MAVIPLTEQGDVKLYILCIMQNVGYPLEYSDINDLALYEGFISNMDFIEAFDSLEEGGLVRRGPDGLYSVTEDGVFIAQTLKSELSGYIHDRGLRAALQYIAFHKSNVKKDIKTTELDDGRVLLELSLNKKGSDIMKISLTLDTAYQAQKMAVAFSENSELVYTRLIALLGGE